jgi:hypothetical protein
MNTKLRLFSSLLIFVFGATVCVFAQSTTASLSGVVKDEKEAVIPNATVTVRNIETAFTRTVQTDGDGRYNFINLPIGGYELTVESASFAKYVQTGITLDVNQNGVVDVAMKAGGVQEVVTVTENASLLNTTTAEVSTRFDERRLAELPISPTGNVYNVLLSVPGVSQLGAGQTGFANGISFSANGGRVRSNNFMVDGQDTNDPSVAGGQLPLNNPDAIQEVRIITNQFLAEYGRNSGSVVNIIGKSGTNDYRGSAYIFHNNERLNACSNLDKSPSQGFCNPNATIEAKKRAPFRKEFRYGFTFGGPLPFLNFGEGVPVFNNGKDRTFFFVDYQRWTDRALGSGTTLNGAPTAEGRAILQQFANRPQVAALLRFLPAGTPSGLAPVSLVVGGQTFSVPVGSLTGSSAVRFNDNQGSARIDHRINENNSIYGRYRDADQDQSGTGQVTPPGVTTLSSVRSRIFTTVWNSVINSRMANEVRFGFARYGSTTDAADSSSESIPSIEINDIGLVGFNAAASRTAIGLAVNLPQFRYNDTYQLQDNFSFISGNHTMKFGVDLRRTKVDSFFVPTIRGRLVYPTLTSFVNDAAESASINRPLAGGETIGKYRWNEFYTYAQDEWKITPNFTLTFGLRYEYPGDSFSYLKEVNPRIVAANGNNPAFAFTPSPKIDKNNFMPRIGFNWNPRTGDGGILGFITGGDKLVVRGGYSRTYDANFINLNLNIFSSFPFVAAVNLPTNGAFTAIQNFTTPNISNPNQLTRTVVSEDFRAPASDQFSLEFQRELPFDSVFKIGYVGTKGTGLFQTVDGNPRGTVCTRGGVQVVCNALNRNAQNQLDPILAPRLNPNIGIIRLRTNSAWSSYHSMQVSLDKRLSRNFSGGIHYTWSSFIDTASEVFNPSSGEIAVAQDSFNLRADKARSSYDRPHRFTGNFVYELPFFEKQEGFLGKILGGFQVNSFFTLQSGAPFTVLNGVDVFGALSGIDGLVGNAIRPNLNTTLPLSRLSIQEIIVASGGTTTTARNLFSPLVAGRDRVGNVGRNTLRADDIMLVDFGIIKNTRIGENMRVQLRLDAFNALNKRNFGIPNAQINSSNFLNQWGTDGGNRRIVLGARFVF